VVSISLMSPREILAILLPHLITAARYSRAVQRSVRSLPNKDEDIFKGALSDADISIQTMLEVILLAHVPDVRFYGEEAEKSLNSQYFQEQSLYEILLDPIDGTRFFLDGHTNYQVVCSITDGNRFEAALALFPHRNQYIGAYRGLGAFTGSFDIPSLEEVKPYRIRSSDDRVLLGTNAQITLPDDIRWLDLHQTYLSEAWSPNIGDFLWGDLGAVASRGCLHIDWGALAFIAQEAGAEVSSWDGSPLPLLAECVNRAYPHCLIAATPQLHSRLLSHLSQKVR
jgi:myo-inositol-1(or 4)-monophosphatase